MKPRIAGLKLLSIALLVLVTLALLVTPAAAEERLNIGLVRFEALVTGDGVRLEWDVESEVGTAGYKIKRAENGGFEYLARPDGNGDLLINSEGGPAQAFSYAVDDPTAVYGKTYTYQLIEITTSASEQLQAETTVTYEIIATNTPITFSGNGGNPGGSASQSATNTPAPTAPATFTPGAQATATAPAAPTVSAPTPLPTATSIPSASAVPAINTVQNDARGDDAETGAAPQIATAEPNSALEAAPQIEEQQSAPAVAVAQALEPMTATTAPDQTDDVAANTAVETTSAANPAPVAAGEDGLVVVSGATSVDGPGSAVTAAPPSLQQEPENDSSRFLLWGAFVIALLIFLAAVAGAIMLYTRGRSEN